MGARDGAPRLSGQVQSIRADDLEVAEAAEDRRETDDRLQTPTFAACRCLRTWSAWSRTRARRFGNALGGFCGTWHNQTSDIP